MVIPNKFGNTGEPILATFSYQDVVDGAGVVTFFLGKAAIVGTDSFILDPNVFYSDEISANLGAATYTYEFDTKAFNSTRVANGTAYLNIGIFNSAANGTTSFSVQLIRDRATVLTNVSSAVLGKLPEGAGGHKMMNIPIPMTTTTFEKDDILRCKIIHIINNGITEIGFDPMGRDGVQITGLSTVTQSKLFVPFEIDL